MKKLLIVMAMLSMTIGTMAENLTVAANVTLPQNGTAEIEIGLTNPNSVYASFSLELNLPNGVVPVMASNGYPDFTLGTRFTVLQTGYINNNNKNIATFAHLTDGNAITGTSGKLFAAKVRVDGEVQVGTVLNATISNIKFTTTELVNETLDNVNFTITIGEPVDGRTVLDEESTTAPTSATGVDVRVKRTIATGVWNTICLPFAMDATQVKAAFGNNVKLGDFAGCVTETDANENVTGITVNFVEATAIEANHPYIIKVDTENDIEEFTVDGVDIIVEEEPSVNKDELRLGSGKPKDPYVYLYNSFIGSYVKDTEVPEMALFLNSNKFWYSTGNTKMKGFRGYFYFYEVLDSYSGGGSARISFNNEVTEVKDVKQVGANDGRIYNMQGQQVEQPGKGLYIKDGKVFMNK